MYTNRMKNMGTVIEPQDMFADLKRILTYSACVFRIRSVGVICCRSGVDLMSVWHYRYWFEKQVELGGTETDAKEGINNRTLNDSCAKYVS
jgi:hypothetical protein